MQTLPAEATDWIAAYADEPDKVRAFCVRHGILDYVRTTLELTKRHFAPIHSLTLSLRKDPCDGTEKARVEVEIRASVEEARAQNGRFLDERIKAAPFSEWDKIGFSYYIG